MWIDDNRKKVLILTRKDFAGSGIDFCDSLNEFSKEFQARLVAFKNPNFGVKSDIITTDKKYIQELISSCDIVHIKGDDPLKFFSRLNFKGKPIFQTVGGSNFRRKSDKYIEEVATGRYRLSDYKNVVLSGITPELTEKWLPHAFDVKKNVWQQPKGIIRIGHSPSDRTKKGTDLLIEAIKDIEGVELVLMENMTNKEVLECKKNIHLFVDQLIIDAYGKSAVECMALGVPVISSCKEIEGCPVFRVESNTIEEIKEVIEHAIKSLNKTTSNAFFKWAKDTHSKSNVCKKLEDFYNSEHKVYRGKKNSKVSVFVFETKKTKKLPKEIAFELNKLNKVKIIA